ncbi:MAG: XRE family transcriptional regulator [Erysipelotrichaceae bacterium]|nr:XRE family transcriptional regulator [Erysipelotrichaceae bacterium]
MNKQLLRSVMIANGDNFRQLADYLGITVYTLSKKINERNNVGFNQREILRIKDRYTLNADQVDSIFFCTLSVLKRHA